MFIHELVPDDSIRALREEADYTGDFWLAEACTDILDSRRKNINPWPTSVIHLRDALPKSVYSQYWR